MMYDTGISSSPDPISILPASSPAKYPRRTSRGPLAPRSSNVTSPSKSVVLDATDGKSPWRIKVTVEAAPDSQIDRSPVRRPRRMAQPQMIPLKDANTGSPVKRKGRSTRTTVSEAGSGLQRARRPTPPRRRVTPARGRVQPLIPTDNEDVDPAILAMETTTGPDSTPVLPSSRESLSKTAPPEHQTEDKSMWREMIAEPLIPDGDANDDADYSLSEDEDEEEDAVSGAPAPGELTVLESEEFSMISVDSLTSNHREGTLSPPSYSQHATGSSAKPSRNRNLHLSYMPSSPPVITDDRLTPLMEESSPALPAPPVQTFANLPKIMSPLRQSAVRSGKVLQDIVRSPELGHGWTQDEEVKRSVFGGFSTGTRRLLRESLHIGQELEETNGQSMNFTSPLDNNSKLDHSQHLKLGNERSHHRLPTPEEYEYSQPNKSSATDLTAPLEYPSLAVRLEHTSLDDAATPYDAMSWVKTGPAKPSSLVESVESPEHVFDRIEIRQCDDVRSDQAKADASSDKEVIDISSGSSSEADSSYSEAEVQQDFDVPAIEQDDEEDIWQEEASRSIMEVEQSVLKAPKSEILSEGPIKPRRAKLPRTWRRTSAHNFNYSDSPEPEDFQVSKPSRSESSRRSSGVLTPPATEDEGTIEEEGPSGVFDSQPSEKSKRIARRTHTAPPKIVEEEDESPTSDDSENTENPDGDTGLFWHTNLPSIFNGRRRPLARADETSMMSDLKNPLATSPLKAQAESSPLRNTFIPDETLGSERSPIHMESFAGKVKRSPDATKTLNSPLRKSLLKSSKVMTCPLGKTRGKSTFDSSLASSRHEDSSLSYTVDDSVVAQDEPSDVTESASMASDTRQLLNEMAAHQRRAGMVEQAETDEDRTVDEGQEESEVGTATPLQSSQEDETVLGASQSDISRSYHEELNHASPSRIAVKFNDSSVLSSSALLPKKIYPPLFDNVPALQPTSTKSAAEDAPPSPYPEPQTSVFARMTSSFWSTITTKETTTAPQSVAPSPNLLPQNPTTATPAASVPDHILRLRRKYGLLPNTHPFTYAHIRTLHRMLNSTRHHGSSSIIPTTIPLPPTLARSEGTLTTNARGQTLTWSPALLSAIAAFTTLLLPAPEIVRLEALGRWGDAEAAKARDFDSRGRHGSWFVFGAGKGDGVEAFEIEWLVGVVSGIVWKEERDVLAGGTGGRGDGIERRRRRREREEEEGLHKVRLEA